MEKLKQFFKYGDRLGMVLLSLPLLILFLVVFLPGWVFPEPFDGAAEEVSAAVLKHMRAGRAIGGPEESWKFIYPKSMSKDVLREHLPISKAAAQNMYHTTREWKVTIRARPKVSKRERKKYSNMDQEAKRRLIREMNSYSFTVKQITWKGLRVATVKASQEIGRHGGWFTYRVERRGGKWTVTETLKVALQ